MMIAKKHTRQPASKKKGLRAQSIIEYVTLLAIVGTAVLSMQLYFKMGAQAGIRNVADYIGSQKLGTAEVDYDYIYHTDGIKGVQSVSETFTNETGKTDIRLWGTKGGHRHHVGYDSKEEAVTEGVGTWSVGIERAQVGLLPGE